MGPNPATSEEPPPAAAGQGQRTAPTPFLTKTYQMVDDPSVDDVISWNGDGTAFVVWRRRVRARPPPQVLQAQQLLQLRSPAQYLRKSKVIKKEKFYEYSAVVPDRWEFANESFRRGEKHLLCEIHRRKISLAAAAVPAGIPLVAARVASPASSASTGSSGRGAAAAAAAAAAGRSKGESLTEENERLRRENTKLAEELAQMKNLCNNILHLMSRYVSAEQFRMDAAAAAAAAAPRGEREGDGAIAKLFGVPIGIKRPRESDLSPRSSRCLPDPQQSVSELVVDSQDSVPERVSDSQQKTITVKLFYLQSALFFIRLVLDKLNEWGRWRRRRGRRGRGGGGGCEGEGGRRGGGGGEGEGEGAGEAAAAKGKDGAGEAAAAKGKEARGGGGCEEEGDAGEAAAATKEGAGEAVAAEGRPASWS
uniref:HSF-type DNA-binding domain-containing protein n=1 Tax=Ananas comosus var. bracteatus TaxID=296719 RepID=A0A6V7PXJ7_ANACO|nr:unnamed protein product [Ananas comosus var. bracteatus]